MLAAGELSDRESVIDEVVQESITESSTQQTTQTSNGVEVTTSGHTVTSGSSGTDSNQVAREVVETTMLPWREAGDMRKVVQESSQETTESSTQQTTQMTSELGISQQATQSTTDIVMTTGENAVDYIRLHGKDARGRLVVGESSGHYECQVCGNFTNVTGTGVRESLTGGVVQTSTQESTESSTQQTTTQASSSLDIEQQTSRSGLLTMDTAITTGETAVENIRQHGRDARSMLVSGSSSGQSRTYVSENVVAAVARTEGVRVSVSGEAMQEYTQDITGSSTLTTRTASELDITQQTTQLIADNVAISMGKGGINYVRGHDMDVKSTLVAGIADGTRTAGVRKSVTGEVVQESKCTEETHKTTQQTTQTQSEFDVTASSKTVLDAIVVSEGENVWGSVTGETTHTSDEVDITTSGNNVRLANSSGTYGGRSAREIADVRVLPGKARVNQVATGDVRESTGVTTNQSTLRTKQTSAEVAVVTPINTVRFVESSGTGGDRKVEEAVDVTVLLESGGVRESVKGKIVREHMSTEETRQASTQHTTEASSELDVTTSSNTITFIDSETYGGRGVEATIVSGRENIRESVTGTVQKSLQEIQSSTQLTMRTSPEVDVTTSTTPGSFTESLDTYGRRGTGGAVDVASVTGKFVQESTGESTDSTHLIIKTPSELDIAQKTAQSEDLITDSVIPLMGNTPEESRGPGRDGMGQQVAGETSENAWGSVTGRESTQEIVESSTLQTTITSAEPDIPRKTGSVTTDAVLTLGENAVEYIRGHERYGKGVLVADESSGSTGHVLEGVADVSGALAEGLRRSATDEIVQEFTQEITESLTLQTTSSELHIEATQAGTLISDNTLSLGESSTECIRGAGRDKIGRQVSGETSGQGGCHAMWNADDVAGTGCVQGSVLTNEIAEKEASTQAITESSAQQATQTSSERNIALETTQSGSLTTDISLTVSENAVEYIRGSGRDAEGMLVAGESSGRDVRQVSGDITDVSVPECVRESVTGEVVQESTQEVTKLSTQQPTAQISSEITQQTTQSGSLILDTALTMNENAREYNRLHGRDGALVGPGSADGIRELIKGKVRQESTEAITGSLMPQTTQASSENDIAQQTTQSGSLATDTTTGRSTVEYIRLHGKDAMGTLVTGGAFDQSGSYTPLYVGDVTGTEGVRVSVMQESTHGIAELSTQQTTTKSSSELDIAQQTIQSGSLTSDTIITTGENTVDYIRLHARDAKGILVAGDVSGQSGNLILGEVANVTGTESVRESATGEIVWESTQGITESSTLQTTQMSSELDIAQQTTQSGSLITGTLNSLGTNGVNYIRGRGGDRRGTLVADGSSKGVREIVTGEVVLGSTSTEEKNGSSPQQTTQTMQTSSELSLSQQTIQSGSITTGANAVEYIRLHGRDASDILVASESSGQVSITGDAVQELTQEATESSTQLITQRSSELDITQQTTQSGSLIADALTLGGRGVKYIRGPERDEMGSQVSDEASEVLQESITGEVVQESTIKSSTLQTIKTSTELNISQQTPQSGGLISDAVVSLVGNVIGYVSGRKSDAKSEMVSSESSETLRDSVFTGEVVRGSTQEVTESSMQLTTQQSSELNFAQQTTQLGSLTSAAGLTLGSNTYINGPGKDGSGVREFSEYSGQFGDQFARNVINVAGSENVQESITGEVVGTATQETTYLSTAVQESSELSTSQQTTQSGGLVTYNITSLGKDGIGRQVGVESSEIDLEYVTGEKVHESTEDVPESSTLQSTTQPNASQETTQSMMQTANDVLTLGGNYIRERGRDGLGTQISGKSSERFRESVTKGLVQESTSVQETMQTPTLQTTQLGSQITNPVVSLSQSTDGYTRVLGRDESGIQVSDESSGQFAGHVMRAITDVTGREGVPESPSIQELTESLTKLTIQTSSELATAQQITKGLITDNVLSLSRNAVDYIRGHGKDGMERQVSGESSGDIREPVKGELVESSMHEIAQSSAQHPGQRTELDIAEQTTQSEGLITDNHIRVPWRAGMGMQFSDDREAVAAEVARESTSTVELAASSTLRTIHTSSELDISQQNTRSGNLVSDTVLTLGDNTVEYTGEPGRNWMDMRVASEYSAQHESQVVEGVPGVSGTEDVGKLTGEIVQESTGTKDITGSLTLQKTQPQTSSGIEIVQQNTTSGGLIADIIPSLGESVVDYTRESGGDRADGRVSSTLSEGSMVTVTGEIAPESMSVQDFTEVSKLQTTQTSSELEISQQTTRSKGMRTLDTTQTSSELDISLQNTQSEGLITDTIVSPGGDAVDYTRERGRHWKAVWVSAKRTAQLEGRESDDIADVADHIRESVVAQQSTKESTNFSGQQTIQESSELDSSQQTIQSRSPIMDAVASLGKSSFENIRGPGTNGMGMQRSVSDRERDVVGSEEKIRSLTSSVSRPTATEPLEETPSSPRIVQTATDMAQERDSFSTEIIQTNIQQLSIAEETTAAMSPHDHQLNRAQISNEISTQDSRTRTTPTEADSQDGSVIAADGTIYPAGGRFQKNEIDDIRRESTQPLQPQQSIQASPHSTTETISKSDLGESSQGVVLTTSTDEYGMQTSEQSQASGVTVRFGKENGWGFTAGQVVLGSVQGIAESSMEGAMTTEQKIRESMEQDVRVSTQKDVDISLVQDVQSSIQHQTSHLQTTQASPELEVGISTGRVSVGKALGEYEGKRKNVDVDEGYKEKSMLGLAQMQESEHFQGATQRTLQASTQQSAHEESRQQSFRSSPRRPPTPSLLAHLGSAAPSVSKQYATATQSMSLGGLIRGAVVTLAEAAVGNYYVRGDGRDGAGTRDSMDEQKVLGVGASEGAMPTGQTVTVHTAAQLAQETDSSSNDNVQTKTQQTLSVMDGENLPADTAVIETRLWGRGESLGGMASITAQNKSSSTVQGAKERTYVSETDSSAEATGFPVRTGVLMDTTVAAVEDGDNLDPTPTGADEGPDESATYEHGGGVQRFNATTLSAEMNQAEARNVTTTTVQNIESGFSIDWSEEETGDSHSEVVHASDQESRSWSPVQGDKRPVNTRSAGATEVPTVQRVSTEQHRRVSSEPNISISAELIHSVSADYSHAADA
ncbi:hypothetical protein JB92DRAFT_2886126 [Gautieria morchelliformis]|nr:hypothetical protein JB92DRAFT_2886126 [Gautieria morchelliformis]